LGAAPALATQRTVARRPRRERYCSLSSGHLCCRAQAALKSVRRRRAHAGSKGLLCHRGGFRVSWSADALWAGYSLSFSVVGALKRITIRRFKRLQAVTIDLDDVTVLVGANNSGKSSVLQAIHFAVAVAQSARLVGTGINWARESFQLSFSPTQLLYTPIADVLALAPGGALNEDALSQIEVILEHTDGTVCTVSVRRGRNRNIQIELSGRALGERLQDIAHPFSVYAPGLAGVPREELLMSLGSVRRAIARGDANLVLRNVLHQLSLKKEKWTRFIEDLNKLFPGAKVSVKFDSEIDEHIRARISLGGGPFLPLDAAGTAVLQASQLLGYATLFEPSIMILDEPDSHLHPNNQRALCSLLFKLSAKHQFQVLASTHSRHVLDAMRGQGRLVWLHKGSVVAGADFETTKILLDIGALDSVDYFADGELKCVVATEDENTDMLKTVLWASGFRKEDTEVVSYAGCSKVDTAVVLARFLKDKAPNIHLVVHRDRDYMSENEVAKYITPLQRVGIHAFVTDGNDIESYFADSEHVAAADPRIAVARAEELLQAAVHDVRTKSIEAIINLRTERAFRRRTEEGAQPNHGQIGTAASTDFDADAKGMARGKMLLGRLTALIQQEIGGNPTITKASPRLAVTALSAIANAVWPPAG
jgi:energy-coupling factor transporter ATP-binding protein EcfA2